jgi:Fe-S-cluster-containing hydrogenase component 2
MHMAEKFEVVSALGTGGPSAQVQDADEAREFIRKLFTRRTFLEGSGAAAVGAAAFYLVGCSDTKQSLTPRQVYVANAQGMVVADPTRCVGCRRCEAACVAFNEGNKAQPSMSKVKVGRNLLWGAAGPQAGNVSSDGLYGNFRVVQDTCRQCPHPVPCQLACPHGAIEVVPPVNARVVNKDKCKGCGICVQACPWAMTSLDGPVNGKDTKAIKCTLCDGNPECVQACPASALTYLAWEDRTKEVPTRQVVPASIQLAPDVKDTCAGCH